MPHLRWERGARAATANGKLKPGPGKSAEDVARNQRARIQSAIAEILAEQGYEAITVRTLARSAGISTRAFYQCYSGKEECFLELHREVVRGLRTAMDSSHATADGSGALAVEALWDGLSSDPVAAKVVLVDINVVGARARLQARRAERSLEGGLSRYLVANRVSLRVSEGVVSGLLGIARSCLVAEGYSSFPGLREEMLRWALACLDWPSVALEEISTSIDSKISVTLCRTPADDEVDLFLNAAARLAAGVDPLALSTRNILASTGLPRRTFVANFESLEDCVVRAREAVVRGATDRSLSAAADLSDGPRRVARFVRAFCGEVERDPVLAGFCFGPLAKSYTYRINHQVSVQAFMANLIDQVLAGSSAAVGGLGSEVSVAACWGLLEKRVAAHGPSAVFEISPILTYLVLAPAIGPAEAVETIRKEYDFQNATREECLINHG